MFAPVEPLGLVVVDGENRALVKTGGGATLQRPRSRGGARPAGGWGLVVSVGPTPFDGKLLQCEAKKVRPAFVSPERVDNITMPLVRVVDMRAGPREREKRGSAFFSPQLHEAFPEGALEQNEQVMLFLNRRGWSSSLQCPDCGYVAKVSELSFVLTYHRPRNN
ncbi:MAG: hypothetical protein CM1200mP29_16360 [Verrucomicrobiota bacterium]|nr:MAG: hypothetical protein CM1200mP29_16360 [Verrucomicrobiota bacterium]